MPGRSAERERVAEVEWKGAIWKAAYGSLSVKEILTILKGFGPMETLEFEKPGLFRGHLSLSLSEEKAKVITLYHLDVAGEQRQGQGRLALQWLKKIFKGELYVEDPGVIRVKNANERSGLFWVQMFREGLIDAIDGGLCVLNPGMTGAEVDAVERRIQESLEELEDFSPDKPREQDQDTGRV